MTFFYATLQLFFYNFATFFLHMQLFFYKRSHFFKFKRMLYFRPFCFSRNQCILANESYFGTKFDTLLSFGQFHLAPKNRLSEGVGWDPSGGSGKTCTLISKSFHFFLRLIPLFLNSTRIFLKIIHFF
jgi:hypothetical protein